MAERGGIFSGDDPFTLIEAWMGEAGAAEPNDPNAVALATVDGAGLPNVRVVLLKAVEPGPAGGLLFYTNYEGRKGMELAANPRAALVMHWKTLRRQIRARGPVERVEPEVSDAYYASRGLDSRLGAWASAQSRPLESRQALMDAVNRARADHGDDPPRPPHWGGFRLRPVELEFWADGAARLHDRFRWCRDDTRLGDWRIDRLQP